MTDDRARVADALSVTDVHHPDVCDCGHSMCDCATTDEDCFCETESCHGLAQQIDAILPLLAEARAAGAKVALGRVVTERARKHWDWAEGRRQRHGDEGCVCELCGVMARIAREQGGDRG